MDFVSSSNIQCTACGERKQASEFSKSQLRKPDRVRCKSCIQQASSQKHENNNHNNATNYKQIAKKDNFDNNNHVVVVTPIEITPRPQRPIPGFEGVLTCCTDWPKTKSGKAPSAQSAIFMPLLAIVVGPIEGYNTAEQLHFASQWWSEALPAWPRWVDLLRESGVQTRREELIRTAKGHPNPLIPKAKGHGTVPHFRGRMQTEVIESSLDVAVELYACVTYLYSGDQ